MHSRTQHEQPPTFPSLKYTSFAEETRRIAILSDIHGSLEGLQAVLSDIDSQGIRTIYNLGDIVGYGPNPSECIEALIAKGVVSIRGNHEHALLADNVGGLRPAASKSLAWTRSRLSLGEIDYLSKLPAKLALENLILVHGSPRSPTFEYIFKDDARDTEKMNANFSLVRHLSFNGHTHIPGVFWVSDDLVLYFTPRAELSVKEEESAHGQNQSKFMINVGSASLSRDADYRASYVIFDATKASVEFRRVEFDIRKTVEEIRRHPELSDSLSLYSLPKVQD
jgi:predicted phosphodiesterase